MHECKEKYLREKSGADCAVSIFRATRKSNKRQKLHDAVYVFILWDRPKDFVVVCCLAIDSRERVVSGSVIALCSQETARPLLKQ